jgi:hypothetical protein
MNGALRETEGEGAVPSFERVNGRRQAFTLKLAGSLAAAGLARAGLRWGELAGATRQHRSGWVQAQTRRWFSECWGMPPPR